MWREIFTNFIASGKMRMGISSLSKLTGISTRQLRYWEEKGYIHSIETTEKNTTRHYDIHMVIKVQVIQHYLEEGYTLAAAVKHAEYDRENMQVVKTMGGPLIDELIANKEHDYLFEIHPEDTTCNQRLVVTYDAENKVFTYRKKEE